MSEDTIHTGDVTLPTGPEESDIELLRKHLQPKYKIEKKLGSGGMADVYLGFHQQLKRKVAVKVLPRVFSRDEAMVQRFLQEAESAAQLDHPNIIGIYDIGVASDLNFFIMAFVPGGSLKDKLKTKKKLNFQNACKIIIQLCHALNYAHIKGVIHRDIKPDNIMFDEHDNAIVTDFGIAKAKFGSRLTSTGTLIGTPHYMSPEQLRGMEVDGRSDIYSLGIMFYEILTGKVPFDGEDTYSVGLKHLQDTPVPPFELNPKIPEQLNNVILTMLAKMPEARFTSAKEVADCLERILRGDTTAAEKIQQTAQAAVETWRMKKADVEAGFKDMQETIGPTDVRTAVIDTGSDGKTFVRDTDTSAKKGKSSIVLFAVVAVVVVVTITLGVVFLPGMFDDKQSVFSSESSDSTDYDRSNNERVSERRNDDPLLISTFFESNDLLVARETPNGIRPGLITDQRGQLKPMLDSDSQLTGSPRDIIFSPAANRYVIEQVDGSLVTMNTSGYDLTLIHLADDGGKSPPRMPSWSSDGTRIVYTVQEGGKFFITIAEISPIGTMENKHMSHSMDSVILYPQFLPDQYDGVVFATYDDQQNNSEIFYFEDESEVESLFTLDGQVQEMIVSSELEALVCISDVTPAASILTMWSDEDNGFSVFGEYEDILPYLAISDDGTTVLFSRFNNSTKTGALYSLNLVSGEISNLVDSGYSSPVFPIAVLAKNQVVPE